MTWAQRFRFRAYVRTSLWIVPAACVVLAIVLAELVSDVDRVSDDLLDGVVNVDTARASLSATHPPGAATARTRPA